MVQAKKAASVGRKPRSLEEEIAAQREKLRKLEERQREQQRKDRERNTKAVLELIRSEKLDMVPSEQWRVALPAIKAALLVGSAAQSEPGDSPDLEQDRSQPEAKDQ